MLYERRLEDGIILEAIELAEREGVQLTGAPLCAVASGGRVWSVIRRHAAARRQEAMLNGSSPDLLPLHPAPASLLR